jgi:riboflavin synthase
MFSGIIERLARVRDAEPAGGSLKVTIETGYPDLELGESIAVNGVCLTVAAHGENGAAEFFLSPETLDRSNLGAIAVGDLANLERSVRLESRLSGHLVQGHVDGEARLASVRDEAGAYRLEFDMSGALARYCVAKGSIALNGISLTINTISEADDGVRIGVMIIPHTWEHTNLHAVRVGDAVNVEVDVIAKYVERLCQPYLKP